jgi:hypothetical protein
MKNGVKGMAAANPRKEMNWTEQTAKTVLRQPGLSKDAFMRCVAL